MGDVLDFLPLITTEAGITHSYADTTDGGCVLRSEADVAPILEANKAKATHNDGYNRDRTWRRVATIPTIIQQKWLIEEGWDCLSPDPGCQRKLAEKLDSIEYQYLRTAPGRLGVHKPQF